MNKQLLLIVVIFLICFTHDVLSQEKFQRAYGGAGQEWGNWVRQTTDGGYIVAGMTETYGEGGRDVYLVKVSCNGMQEWSKTIGDAGNEEALEIQQTTDGGYILGGFTSSYGAGGEDMLLIKTDNSGNVQWSKAYGGASNDKALSVKQTNDNGYILLGYTNSYGAGGVDIYMVKTNNIGDTLWTKTYGGANEDYATSVAQTIDSGYIISGTTQSYGAGLRDVYLIKTDQNGAVLWTKTYGAGNHEEGTSVQELSDGYIIAGYTFSYGAGMDDSWLIKTDFSGNVTWTKTYGNVTFDSWISNVEQTTDGGYIISTMTYLGPGQGYDAYMIKTDASGNSSWGWVYGGLSYDEGYAIHQTTDGGYIMTGETMNLGVGNYDIYLIKTDASGSSGCNEMPFAPIVNSPSPNVGSGVLVGAGAVVTAIVFTEGSGIIQTDLCATSSSMVTIDTIGWVSSICVNAAADTLKAAPPGGVWSGTGITDTSNGVFDPGVAGVGTHTITYTLSASCGGVDSIDITVDSVLSAAITPAGPFCPGDGLQTLTAATPGGTWSGIGITDPVNGIFDPAIAGADTVTYAIGGLCGDTQTTVITIDTLLNAAIIPAGPFCPGDGPQILTAATPGGVWSGTGITDTINGVFDPGVAGMGTHTISYTLSASCGGFDTMDIIVNSVLSAAITPAGPFCLGDGLQTLTAATPGGTWSGTGITDPVNGIFDPAVAGIGTDTITYAIGGLCGDTQTTVIIVDSLLDAAITPAGPFCSGDGLQTLTAAMPGGVWSGTGITDPVNGIFDPAVVGGGTHTITYALIGSCGDTQTTNIQVGAVLSDAGPGITICAGNGEMLQGSETGGSSYLWSPSTGLSSSNILAPLADPLSTTTYVLTISDGLGCSAQDSVLVTVANCAIFIPNTFTPNPNDDIYNNVFYVRGKGIGEIFIKVYNRWGERVFESQSIDDGWDGKYKNKDVGPGVFVYIVEGSFVNGDTISKKGNLTLLR